MEYNVFSQPMNSYSNNPPIERAQPWLGTFVSIRVSGLDDSEAHRAIDEAFSEIALVHRLMSFHDSNSDASRLNCGPAGKPVAVHPYTVAVLQKAQMFSSCLEGCFDISIGSELVDWQLLPTPSTTTRPAGGSWRDIEILPDGHVVFHRPLWIDFGGIAKGYAVDRATDCLRRWGAAQSVVNAGGDIRVQGQCVEPIRLAVESSVDTMPVLELTDGSVASSSGHRQRRWHKGRLCGPHVDGARRSPAATDRFVCVLADECVLADALTKIVMARGRDSVELLRRFAASAHVYDPTGGWQHLEREVES
jgi:thiamine biosynthesis lipoprotein